MSPLHALHALRFFAFFAIQLSIAKFTKEAQRTQKDVATKTGRQQETRRLSMCLLCNYDPMWFKKVHLPHRIIGFT
jgi:hypothetical protein